MACAPTDRFAPSIEDVAVMEQYLHLLMHGYTECAEHEHSGPSHGEKGPELDDWLEHVAEPWFAAIEMLAAEDGLGVKTYQGFDAYLSGSTPSAQLLDRNGEVVQLSTRDRDADGTLIAACGGALLAARARRGLATRDRSGAAAASARRSPGRSPTRSNASWPARRALWFPGNRRVNQNESSANNATASIDVFSAASCASP